MNGVWTATPHPTGSRTIEDNRSTSFPSASSQCSSVVLWLYLRLSAYPSALVGFAVRRVGPCYVRGVSGCHAVSESIEFGPLHRTLRGAGFREQPNSRTIEDNRSTIRSQAIEDSRSTIRSRTIEDNRSTLLPSASSQCSLVVLWFNQRLSAYPGSLVGFATPYATFR